MPPKGKKNAKTDKKKAMPSKAATKAVKDIVHRVISNEQESKLVIAAPYASNLLFPTLPGNFTCSIASNAELYALIPQISQGTGDHQRIGNVIRPTSLTFRGKISVTSNQQDAMLYAVDVFFLTSVQVKDASLVGQVDMASFLDRGNGLNQQYSGNYVDSILPINNKQFKLLKRFRVILTKPQGAAQTGTVCGGTSESGVVSADGKIFKDIVFKVPMPATLKYATDAVTQPQNYFPFMCVGWTSPTNCNGVNNQSTDTISVDGRSFIYYKDA